MIPDYLGGLDEVFIRGGGRRVRVRGWLEGETLLA